MKNNKNMKQLIERYDTKSAPVYHIISPQSDFNKKPNIADAYTFDSDYTTSFLQGVCSFHALCTRKKSMRCSRPILVIQYNTKIHMSRLHNKTCERKIVFVAEAYFQSPILYHQV